MKINAKELAKNEARIKKNADLNNEGHVVGKDILDEGSHIKEMASFIEAIHSKDPAKAHGHMVNYAKSLADIHDGEDNKMPKKAVSGL